MAVWTVEHLNDVSCRGRGVLRGGDREVLQRFLLGACGADAFVSRVRCLLAPHTMCLGYRAVGEG